jgi:hypothetical protein
MYKGISHCLFRIARKEGMVRKTTTLFLVFFLYPLSFFLLSLAVMVFVPSLSCRVIVFHQEDEKTGRYCSQGAWYKGLGASLCGIVPYASVDLGVYFSLKEYLASKEGASDPGVGTL